MKTVTLRFLLNEPLKVKRLNRSGQSITVVDKGSQLCVIRPAAGKGYTGVKARRRRPLNWLDGNGA
ncbi:MAG TPA: hypothetical protein VGY98_01785 [Verrucomicrobiae bacterium]|nr:hypothetical protein [Verrucomicrobiae bacterium]